MPRMSRFSLVKPAATLAAIAGTVAVSAMLLADDPTPQATNGMDLSVSAVSATTGGSPSFTVHTTGVAAGMFGLTMGTTSCNVGNVYVPFQAAMQFNHPYIVQNVYRTTADGRLEHLAASWIKHAFSSASTSQAAVAGPNGQPACGTGSCDGIGGTRMGFNCADTYGAGLNASTYYLGPRSELKSNDVGFTAAGTLPAGRTWLGWNPRGAFFDNYTTVSGQDQRATAGQNDGARTYTTGSTSTPWKFCYLRDDEINTAALGTTGRIFMEAYYVVNGDVAKLNNHAWRRYRVTGTRTFAMDGPHTFGPVLLSWGDQQQLAQPTTGGSVYVSSRVVPAGTNSWRYEYNVYNLDYDKEIAGLQFSTLAVAVKEGVSFRQPRQTTPAVFPAAAYDNQNWVSSLSAAGDQVVFSPVANPVDGQGNALQRNTIRWGTMYTFHYTSNLPPRSTGVVTITGRADRPGDVSEMFANVSVPRSPADVIGAGGTAPDGTVDGDDFITFINAFAAGLPAADIAAGGDIGADGTVDGNDFIMFINWFSLS